ncbi:hypothetical protein CRUP_023603 [Coryphaenoides rupestris]|nr:hypothetical protein CRUP_023603 [Coryphaenoides rupestris]
MTMGALLYQEAPAYRDRTFRGSQRISQVEGDVIDEVFHVYHLVVDQMDRSPSPDVLQWQRGPGVAHRSRSRGDVTAVGLTQSQGLSYPPRLQHRYTFTILWARLHLRALEELLSSIMRLRNVKRNFGTQWDSSFFRAF